MLDGSNWVCVLSDGKNDDDDDDEDDDGDDDVSDDDDHDDSAGDESAAELPGTHQKVEKPKPGQRRRWSRRLDATENQNVLRMQWCRSTALDHAKAEQFSEHLSYHAPL